ncbi:MAG: peptidase [Nitrosopumilus sp.]|nr:peptidase [Nitrosopumilus sp.]
MWNAKYLSLLVIFSIISLIPIIEVDASSNPNLFVSAENSQFNNHFSGSMVVEVVVIDPNLSDTGEGKGEPDVTINGKSLRMVQATDGSWYAYFANVDKAKQADSTVGKDGEGLDFGVFCGRDTPSSVIGISLSETDGFAVPRFTSDSTNGNSPFTSCSGSPSGTNWNNVVRNAKSINTNPNVPSGQIGLNSNAWPLIQLYSFDDVVIQYNPAGQSQQVSLEYDEIPNISMTIDRVLYPENAEVFLSINDFQLNQDPTDEDSWTFDVDSTPSVFYQAYDNSGSNSANGGLGLVDLTPYLSSIGFEDNGKLTINKNSVLKLQSNSEQPDTSVSNGSPPTYSEILTLVEDGPNSGIFDTGDDNDQSVLGILNGAPRGQAGSITYDKKSISVLTGPSSASVSLDHPTLSIGDGSQSLKPGTEFPVILFDPDQNINSGSRDHLDVFRETALIPSITIGNPITLENAQNVLFHTSSLPTGDDANSFVPDSNSDRLHIDTSNVANASYEIISVNLGVSASTLSSTLLDTSNSDTSGTNWINYDLRSLENDLGVTDFTDTSISLYFGTLSGPSITIVDASGITSSQGFVKIDDSDVADISDENGTVFLVIDFDSSNNDSGVVFVSSETNKQPIVFDFFSFGLKNDDSINNSIYRFELEETQDNSSTFEGTFEYAVANQLNILDPNFIRTIQTIDDEIKIIITNRLIDEAGIAISYSDLDEVGVSTTTTTKSDVATNSGTVSASSTTFRFGQPVTLTLKDSDLNLKSDTIESYHTINDPNSPNVDTVGKDGEILLEIKLKDIRYKRCTINGIEYGGLASTGFSLVETGPSTGIFEGVFKMPSQICDKSGTKLISTAGGSLDAKYYDSRDSSGNPNTFSSLRDKPSPFYSSPQLSAYDVVKPVSGKIKEIILSGSIDNHRRGIPLKVIISTPDGQTQNFAATLSSNGGYKSVISINENSLSGIYKIDLFYNDSFVKEILFTVSNPPIPDWIKNNAQSWSSNNSSDSAFLDGIKYFVDKGFIHKPDSSISKPEIPHWIKNNAKWWANDQISDDDYIKSIQYLVKKGIIRI